MKFFQKHLISFIFLSLSQTTLATGLVISPTMGTSCTHNGDLIGVMSPFQTMTGMKCEDVFQSEIDNGHSLEATYKLEVINGKKMHVFYKSHAPEECLVLGIPIH